jgi:predicted anti-sigma-YlaC factor YlaD
MKRKDYATARERMAYQIIGFLTFPLVNIPLGILLWSISQKIDSQLPTLVSALPWLVNGIVLVLAFLLRPEFGVGYIAFIGVAITVITALSVLFVAACFVSILSAAVIGPLAIGLFAILMSAGLLGLGVFAIYVFQSWQSSSKNNSH